MKKHIIIAGVPRAGKSTLCQYISKEYGYQHISMDSIIAGIENVFPETGINSDADMDVEAKVSGISAKIAPFIQSMIDSGEYDECDYGMVIDVYQLLPGDYVRYIDAEKCDIVYLVTADVSVDERVELMQKYDTPKDYTYKNEKAELQKLSTEIVEMSKYYQMECRVHDLPCFNTMINRESVLKRAVVQLNSWY